MLKVRGFEAIKSVHVVSIFIPLKDSKLTIISVQKGASWRNIAQDASPPLRNSPWRFCKAWLTPWRLEAHHIAPWRVFCKT